MPLKRDFDDLEDDDIPDDELLDDEEIEQESDGDFLDDIMDEYEDLMDLLDEFPELDYIDEDINPDDQDYKDKGTA